MKLFNLEEALAGKPVQLRNGTKAFILCNVIDYFPNTTRISCLAGIRSCVNNTEYYNMLHWNLSGCIHEDISSDYDIVGMWEEPELTQEELFKKALNEHLPIRYKGLPDEYPSIYVVAKSISNDYIIEWKDAISYHVALVSNLPKFEWYIASDAQSFTEKQE